MVSRKNVKLWCLRQWVVLALLCGRCVYLRISFTSCGEFARAENYVKFFGHHISYHTFTSGNKNYGNNEKSLLTFLINETPEIDPLPNLDLQKTILWWSDRDNNNCVGGCRLCLLPQWIYNITRQSWIGRIKCYLVSLPITRHGSTSKSK